MSLIDPSPHDAAVAYVVFDRHKLDDFKPYIFKTSDSGKTWTAITAGISEGAYVHAVREDPKKRGLLYAGTETGMYVSFDDGAHWQPLQLNLPVTPIHDLVVKDDDLVVATHGRSFWVLDDITPLRQVTPQSAQMDSLLYQPQTALRLHYPTEFDKRQPVGDNPPAGAILDYYLKVAAKDEVTLDIMDAQGKVVRHLSSKEKKKNDQPPEWPDQVETPRTIPAAEGMNRFAWDLHYDDPIETPGAFYYGEGPRGPLALPGEYQVKMTAGGKTQTVPLHLVIDPRIKDAEPVISKQFELSAKTAGRIGDLHQAINEIRNVKTQIDGLHKRFGDDERLKAALAAADDLKKRMAAVEEQLIQVNMKGSEGNLAFPNMLNESFYSFSRMVEYADYGPTQPQLDVSKQLDTRLDEQLKKWTQLKTEEVPKIAALIRQVELPAISVGEKP